MRLHSEIPKHRIMANTTTAPFVAI